MTALLGKQDLPDEHQALTLGWGFKKEEKQFLPSRNTSVTTV